MLCHNGQLNEKRAPPSSLVSQLTVPPIASAIEWTIASPSPQPPVERSRLGSRRTKGSKICSRFSGAIPGPSKIVPNHFLLVPGIGAQGGSLEEVCKYGMNSTCGLIVNSSRAIIYADKTENFATVAGQEAQKVQAQMEKIMCQ